jgi:hypothetical protein
MSAPDPTGAVPPYGLFRLVTVAEEREPVDPTGVVPLGPGFHGILTELMDPLLGPPAA